MYFQNPEHYTQAAFRKSLLLCTGWRLVKRNQAFIFKKCSPSIHHLQSPRDTKPDWSEFKSRGIFIICRSFYKFFKEEWRLVRQRETATFRRFQLAVYLMVRGGGLRNRSTSWSLETPVVYLEKCSGFRAKDWKRPSQLRKVSFAIVNFCFDISKSQC